MVNSDKFATRLQKIIDFYDESASSFAEKIGVQRSSISHILSGRNKPSLDFVMKILHSYPDVELYWLLNGKGTFPNNVDTFNKETSSKETEALSNTSNDIEKIVIFFNDGTFKSYIP